MGSRRTVARIFNPAYRDVSTFDYRRHFQIDRLLSLEYLTALELAKAIRRRELFGVDQQATFVRPGIGHGAGDGGELGEETAVAKAVDDRFAVPFVHIQERLQHAGVAHWR